MTRGMRLLIVFCVFTGVIVLMMDCAKKTMRKQKTQGDEVESHGQVIPREMPQETPREVSPAAPGPGGG